MAGHLAEPGPSAILESNIFSSANRVNSHRSEPLKRRRDHMTRAATQRLPDAPPGLPLLSVRAPHTAAKFASAHSTSPNSDRTWRQPKKHRSALPPTRAVDRPAKDTLCCDNRRNAEGLSIPAAGKAAAHRNRTCASGCFRKVTCGTEGLAL
jgi:hypothetical protein